MSGRQWEIGTRSWPRLSEGDTEAEALVLALEGAPS